MYHSEAVVFCDPTLGEDIMGQKVLGYSASAGAACGEAIIDVTSDESVLILINHCREMKRQEARLRIITLLLLLGCAALFVYSTCAGLRQQDKPGPSGHGSAGDEPAAYLKHQTGCPAAADAEGVQSRAERTHVHLQSVDTDGTNGSSIAWTPRFGNMTYNREKQSIVIPATGVYFIYLRFILFCQDANEGAKLQNFGVKLHRWSESYPKVTTELDTREGVQCSPRASRNVFVGQLFELEKGDHMSVTVTNYRLIKTSFFGAFLK